MSFEQQKGRNRYNGQNLTKHIALSSPRQRKSRFRNIEKLRDNLLNKSHDNHNLDLRKYSSRAHQNSHGTIQLSSERKSVNSRKNIKKADFTLNVQLFKLPRIQNRGSQRISRHKDLKSAAIGGQIDQMSILSEIQNHLQPKNITKPEKRLQELALSVRTKAGLQAKNIKINQDIEIIDQKLPHGVKLFCVCDGHGTYGHLVAAFIKKKLIENLRKNLKNIQPEYIQQEIYLVFQKTNLELLSSDINTELSGSTVIAVFICGDRIYSFNVGDSRAILINYEDESWKSSPLSHDHKPERQIQAKRIRAYGGRIARQTNQKGEEVGPLRVWMKDIKSPGLAMTRSFGDKAGMKAGTTGDPQVFEFSIKFKNKYLLIASDGIWQHLQNYEIVKLLFPLLNEQKLEDAANLLMDKCIKLWSSIYSSRDDITFILVKLNQLNESH